MRKVPELSLTQLQTLWLNELGVNMLWGSPFKASVPASTSPTIEAVTTPQVASVHAESEENITTTHPEQTSAVSQGGSISSGAQEVGLIKRSSPEGKTKSGRINKALQALHQELQQQSTPKARKLLAMPEVSATTWEALKDEIQQQYLAWSWVQSASEILMGQQGKPQPDLFIIEEMPSVNDALEGQEFSGDCGVLLGNILACLGLSIEEVAISSVFKFHAREEIAAVQYALPYLQAQIQLLQPKCLLFLGARAAQPVLRQDNPMDYLRSQIWQYPLSETQSIPAIVSHHPSLLLINGALKADTWDDLQKIAQVLGK